MYTTLVIFKKWDNEREHLQTSSLEEQQESDVKSEIYAS